MEQAGQVANRLIKNGQNTGLTKSGQRTYETSLRALIGCSSVNGLDLIPSEPVTGEIVMKAAAMVQQNTGVDVAKEKWMMLATMVREEGWTRARFERTLKHLLKTSKWATWTLADWFSHGIDIHPESWYREQVSEHGRDVNKQIEMYLISEEPRVVGYRYIDGNSLPFKRLEPKPLVVEYEDCPKCLRSIPKGGKCECEG